MEIDWSTLEIIANTKAIDVWYLFPYSALYRQAAKSADALTPYQKESLTRILGTEEWRQVFYSPPPQRSLFGNDDSDIRHSDHHQMLEFVSERLKGVFPAVAAPKVLYQGNASKNSSGAPLFALYFAASNPAPKAYGLATKIAKSILDTL